MESESKILFCKKTWKHFELYYLINIKRNRKEYFIVFKSNKSYKNSIKH